MMAITPKIARFRAGSASAFAELFDLFFPRQVRQAEAALGRGRAGLCDGEDVALSAFCSLWREAIAGKFPNQLDDTNGLLDVLQLLTAQKGAQARRYNLQQKRDVRRTIDASHWLAPEESECRDGGKANPADFLPPSISPRQQEIAEKLTEGWTRNEIADQLHCSVRTIDRELADMRAAVCNPVAN